MTSQTSPSSPGPRATHVNSATLVQGVTGGGKTSLLATLMEYVWETWQLVSILYTSDGGGFPDRVQALIRLGICWPFRMRTRDLADGSLSFETIARSTQGWVPAVWNRQTGEVPQGVRMVPPITEQYVMSCPQGHPLKTVPFQSMLTPQLCPVCRVHTTKQNMQVSKTAARTKGLEQVGAVMFDGLTSMTSWALNDMGQRAGRLELKGEEGAIGGKVTSGDMKWGGVTRSHIGFAQARVEEWVLNSLGIPNLVVPPTFTALTLETTDEGGLSVRGPKLAGRAKTDEAPAWFGNCLEAAVVKDDKDQRVYRLYLSEFVDEAGVRHLVKHRGAPGTMPPYLEDLPLTGKADAETSFDQFNLGVFFRLLDDGLQTTLKTIEARYPNAPGASAGLVQIGEAVGSAVAGMDVPAAEASPGVAPVSGAGGAAGTAGVATGGASASPGPTAPPAPSAPPAPPGTHPGTAAPKARVRPSRARAAAAPAAPSPAVAAQADAAVEQAIQTGAIEPPVVGPVVAPPPVGHDAVQQVTGTVQAPQAPPTQAARPGGWAPPAAPRPPAPAPRVPARRVQ